MAIEKVKNYFKSLKLEDRILEFSQTCATVKDAAVAINCFESEIAKSLSFLVNGKPIVIVMAGDVKIDNSKFKSVFGVKPSLIPIQLLNELIGHDVGGICPFAVNENVQIYLDNSLKEHVYLYPAAGSSNSAIKLSLNELEKYSNYTSWVEVSKKISS